LKREITLTSLERKVKEALDKLGVEYVPQYSTRTGFVIDFLIFLNGRKIALEVDGPYHELKEVRRRDKFKDYMLKREGYKVVRVNYRIIDHYTIDDLAEIIYKLFEKLN